MRTLTRYGAIVLAATWLAGCSNTDPSDQLTQQQAISECGGFLITANMKSPLGDPATYCEAEMLHWAYNASTQTLDLANNRMLLNCCGNHSINVSVEDGVYVISEVDAPEFADARCGCMCVFDFTTTVQGIPEGVIPVRIVRDVTDAEGGPQVVYEGSLDLTAAVGSVELDPADVEPWCSGEVPQ
ncbi:MAG: hypothetical protein ABI333_09450 [bacterium]